MMQCFVYIAHDDIENASFIDWTWWAKETPAELKYGQKGKVRTKEVYLLVLSVLMLGQSPR